MLRRLAFMTVVAAAIAGCGDDPELVSMRPEPAALEQSVQSLVAPGEFAAVRLDWEPRQTEVVDPTVPLTELGEQAVARAPSWLRGPLRLRLAMVEPALQDALAQLVVEAPQERVVDEIAFSVANVQEHDLMLAAFEPDIITENAVALYEHAELLGYVELIDSGASGDEDFGTTARYQYLDENGSQASYELDREDYYWWVVHPKLDFEELLRVDPVTGESAAAPGGAHWRRYVMESSEQIFDYRDHYLVRHPHDLRGSDLGLSASAHLTAPAIYPLRLLVDEQQNGLLVEIDHGGGTLLASTVNAAQRYADGHTELLVNYASYGNTNLTLSSTAEVVLLIEQTPWGSDVYSEALDEQGITPTTVDASSFAALDLSDLDKIIVASDQSAAVYQAVADRRADLEAYVSDEGVLQIDLHTTADLTGLVFPGDLQVAEGAPSAVVVEGQPRLVDYIQSTPIVWDSVPYPDLSGGRPPQPSGMALDIIGWFVSQNMYDNVSEYRSAQGVSFPERSWYPQRILYNHYGNCGELGDLMAAAGRAALLPIRQATSMEDHVWNELRFGDRWVSWQVDWSDGPTRIDHPRVAADEEYGGGKTLSAIWTIRGDGYQDESLVEQYTSTITIELSVVDAAGRPVDGARGMLWTESYYEPDEIVPVAWDFADSSGTVRVTVGEGRNYWFHVNTTAVEGARYPVGVGEREQIVAASDILPAGSVIHQEVTLDVLLPRPEVATVANAGADATVYASIDARALRSWRILEGTVTDGHFIKETERPIMQYYLLDQAGYDALLASAPFDALTMAEDASELQVDAVPVPAGPLWLVAYNASVTKTTSVALGLQLQER